MRVIKETETEMYIEVDPNELPLTINSPGKRLLVSLAKPSANAPCEKSLLEFIKALDQLNGANLHNLTGQDASWYKVDEKYRTELKKVMELINGFDFVKHLFIHPLLLSKPVPQEIKDVFGKTK